MVRTLRVLTLAPTPGQFRVFTVPTAAEGLLLGDTVDLRMLVLYVFVHALVVGVFG